MRKVLTYPANGYLGKLSLSYANEALNICEEIICDTSITSCALVWRKGRQGLPSGARLTCVRGSKSISQ